MMHDAIDRIERSAGVVLGLGQNGLATVRALGRRGVPVIGIDSDIDRPTARSRYCVPIRSAEFRTGGRGLVDDLLAIGARLREPAVLFPSGDLNLRTVSAHRDELARYYRISLPAPETVDLILDKRRFYDFASAHGFPIPATVALDATNVHEVAASVRYPVILKPSLRDIPWRREDRGKAYEVHAADELVRAWESLAPLSDSILVQELIVGPDTELAFSLTYLDERSRPLAMFTGRKCRQFPPRFGTSSMAESRWDPEVAEMSVELLRALDYRGYASVEFKRDVRDGRLRVIEVTGRTWYPHGLSTRCGVNLPYLAYCHLLGRPTERPEPFEDGVKWIDEERDVRAALAERRAGRLTVAAWIASYRGRRTYAVSALDDPRPMLELCARAARSAIRRAIPSRTRARVERAVPPGHVEMSR